MAEIKIERKKPLWPWVLIIIMIALVTMFLLMIEEDTQDGDNSTEEDIEEFDALDDVGALNNTDYKYLKNQI